MTRDEKKKEIKNGLLVMAVFFSPLWVPALLVLIVKGLS